MLYIFLILNAIHTYKWNKGIECTLEMECNATLISSAGVFIPNTTFILQVGGTDLEGNTYKAMHLIDTSPLNAVPPKTPLLTVPKFRKGDSLESYDPLIDGFNHPVLCSYENEIILADMTGFGHDIFILNIDDWNWTRKSQKYSEFRQLYAVYFFT